MKVSIVGAGIMGLSTAWALERLGHQVTLFDQGPIPNPQASSYDRHRLIRYAYGADSAYMRMVADAYAIWDRLWADLGATLYVPTGTLCIARTESNWTRRSAETLESGGFRVERLDEAGLARRAPMLNPAGIAEAYYLETGGVLLAERILARLAETLVARGVELRAETPVAAVDPDRGWVTLSNGAVVGADALVVASGAWVARLAPSLRHRVTPSRQVLAYLTPPERHRAAWVAAPMLLDLDLTDGFYAVPPVAGTGLKLGDHRFSLAGDPDSARIGSADEIAPMLAAARARLHDGDAYLVEQIKVCYYTVEPREKFIVEPLGLAGWVMSPCSGHGFKFGPLLGSAVAGAIDSGEAGDLATWAAGEV